MSLTESQLNSIAEANEVLIETSKGDDTTRTIIWVVVADGEVYVRSVQGDTGLWYQRALANPDVALVVDSERITFQSSHVDDGATIEAVSDALRAKYRPGGSLDRMTREEVLDCTLRLDPSDQESDARS